MTARKMMPIGDMTVVDPQAAPVKLLKALAAISNGLHPAFAAQPWIGHADKSKESCILASLTVRDFLRSIGFNRAHVRSVTCLMRATRGDKTLHTLGIGAPPSAYGPRMPIDEPGRWDGHMIVTVGGMLIDTTLYPSIRPQWEGALPGMLAVPYAPAHPRSATVFDRPGIGGYEATRGDHTMTVIWLDRRENKSWKQGGDAEPHRRTAVVKKLIADFGKWT